MPPGLDPVYVPYCVLVAILIYCADTGLVSGLQYVPNQTQLVPSVSVASLLQSLLQQPAPVVAATAMLPAVTGHQNKIGTLAPTQSEQWPGVAPMPIAAPASRVPNVPIMGPFSKAGLSASRTPAYRTEPWDPFTNPYPQGNFEQDFSHEIVKLSNNLLVGWAFRNLSGSRHGDPTAESWQKGKVSSRRCLGVLKCVACDNVQRPKTEVAALTVQLTNNCNCGSRLEHMTCDVVSKRYTWKDGVHYINGGEHQHPLPSQHRLSHGQQSQFATLVATNPKATPSELAVGIEQLNGTAKAAGEIAPRLFNKDALRYERRKVHNEHGHYTGGDEFLAELSALHGQFPGYIMAMECLPPGPYIIVQSDWMREKSANVVLQKEEPVNGFQTDVAHKFWESGALLLITSCYSSMMRQWVPVLISWIPSGSTDAMCPHFMALLRGLSRELRRRGQSLKDEHCMTVCEKYAVI